MSACPVPAQNLLARRQYRRYLGKPVIGGAGYPYVLADTVPLNQYWLVWFVSIIAGKATQLPPPFQLNLIQANRTKPLLAAGANPDDPFFLNYFAFPGRAFGPGAFGMRIDNGPLGTTGGGSLWQAAQVGDEVRVIRRPILVAPGETLMGWSQQSGTPANVGAVLEMRLALSIMNDGDDLELEF